MVQYIVTPWRDRQELLLVRHQFFPTQADAPAAASIAPEGLHDAATKDGDEASRRRRLQRRAVDRVTMWMQRGSCPHMVESTALLTAAILIDEELRKDGISGNRGGTETFMVKGPYVTAFSRFVTGLLDGHQDKLHKQSMYSLAKTIGLPATFVELRHQSAHEKLPSSAKLRQGARKALDWIWDYYWKQLEPDEQQQQQQQPSRSNTLDDEIAQAVLKYLQEDDEQRQEEPFSRLKRLDRQAVVAKIQKLRKTLPGNLAHIKCTKLLSRLETEPYEDEDISATTDIVHPRKPEAENTLGPTEVQQDDRETRETIIQSESGYGWTEYQGVWKPKPFGST